MSETKIVTVRDSDIVAAEINTIKEDTRRVMIQAAIRIGGKLLEAKSMVPFGEWTKWLEEKVDYSQSTADNMMRLYREYGENQESLFDNWTNSQAFANLSYTQHLALLALPFSQRQEFAEENRVEELSTRELQEAVAAHKKAQEDAQARAEQLQRQVEDLKADAEAAAEILRDHQASAQEAAKHLQSRAVTAEASLEKAMTGEKNAKEQLEKLRKKLQAAEDGKKTADEALKKLRENPEVPEAVMEQMRQEVAAQAAQEATEQLRQELEAAQAALAREQEQAAAARKQLQLASPEAAAFKAMFGQVQEDFNRLTGQLLKIRAVDPGLGGKLTGAVMAMLEQQRKALG